jgi:hypothetical protein
MRRRRPVRVRLFAIGLTGLLVMATGCAHLPAPVLKPGELPPGTDKLILTDADGKLLGVAYLDAKDPTKLVVQRVQPIGELPIRDRGRFSGEFRSITEFRIVNDCRYVIQAGVGVWRCS